MTNTNNATNSTLGNGFEGILKVVDELCTEAKKTFKEVNLKTPKMKSFSKLSTAEKVMIALIWGAIAFCVSVPNFFWTVSALAGVALGWEIANKARKAKKEKEEKKESDTTVVETVAEPVE